MCFMVCLLSSLLFLTTIWQYVFHGTSHPHSHLIIYDRMHIKMCLISSLFIVLQYVFRVMSYPRSIVSDTSIWQNVFHGTSHP